MQASLPPEPSLPGQIAIRVHEQIALGEEAREEHAVPVLVGDFGDEVGYGLRVVGAQQIAQRPAMRAQAHTQLLLGITGMRRSLLGSDGKRLEGFLGTGLGMDTRLGDGGFENLAVFAGDGLLHGVINVPRLRA